MQSTVLVFPSFLMCVYFSYLCFFLLLLLALPFGSLNFTPFCQLSVMHITGIFVYFSLKASAALKLSSSERLLFFESLNSIERRGKPLIHLCTPLSQKQKINKTIPREFQECFQAEKGQRCESYALGITKCSVTNLSKENVQVECQRNLQTKYSQFCLAVICLTQVGKPSISNIIMSYLVCF